MHGSLQAPRYEAADGRPEEGYAHLGPPPHAAARINKIAGESAGGELAKLIGALMELAARVQSETDLVRRHLEGLVGPQPDATASGEAERDPRTKHGRVGELQMAVAVLEKSIRALASEIARYRDL